MGKLSKLKLGNKIKEARQAKGLTQFELSELIDTSPEYVSLIENNRRLPSLDTLEQLAGALGVSIVFFFDNDEHKSKKLAKASTRIKIDSILSNQSEINLRKILQLIRISLKS